MHEKIQQPLAGSEKIQPPSLFPPKIQHLKILMVTFSSIF